MANGMISGPPAVDFYSMLSGLGDTIQNNAKIRQQQQMLQDRKDAWSTFSQLDPSSPDYGKQATTIALKLGQAGDQEGASKFLTVAQTAQDRARQAAQDAIANRHQQFMEGLALRTANRADDKTPAGFMPDPANRGSYIPMPGGPQDPTYIARRNEAEAATNKPVPVETIGGTKFLVRDPNSPNGYRMIDPTQLAQPQQPALQPQPQTSIPQTQPQLTQAQPAATGAQPATPDQPIPAQPAQPVDLQAIDPKSGRRENYLQSLDPQIREYIKKVADYEIDPRTTSVRGGMREKLMSAVAQYDPSYNQNDFGARAKAIKDFSTGQQGNIVRSFDVAVDHLDTLQKAATAMQNGDVRALNAIRNAWREQTGSDLPTNFQALVPLVSGEIAKAVIGSNNALSDREELRRNLQNAQSPSQISGVIQGYKALMGGQLKGLKKQYEATTGKKDFEGKLRDVTRQELEGPAASGGQNTTSNGINWSVSP